MEGQTSKRIREAIGRLQALPDDFLHPGDAWKSEYVLMRRFFNGEDVYEILDGDYSFWKRFDLSSQLLWNRLFPWEKYRQLRTLDRFTWFGLAALRHA